MEMKRGRFLNGSEYEAISGFLETWTDDEAGVKSVFLWLLEQLLARPDTLLDFRNRPGVSYSLKAHIDQKTGELPQLFSVVDVIDDDPNHRWLSVCFYAEMITDPEDKGNLIPQGLMGEDGYCFDVFEKAESLMSYIERRTNEAYQSALSVSRRVGL